MITNIKCHPQEWLKDVYIASKLGVKHDEYGNEFPYYDSPNKQPYRFNYQPVNTDAEIVEFGEKVSVMKKAVIPISYEGQFKEFDVAYLDGVTPDGESTNGEKANYRLLPPRNGNSVIIIYFEKMAGK